MSSTISQLERKLNLVQVIKENPWPALALAAGAGFLLAGSKSDVKAAAVATKATSGAGSKVGTLLDEVAARVLGGVTSSFNERVDTWVEEIKNAIGIPASQSGRSSATGRATNTVDRQMSGLDNRAREHGTGEFLGISHPPQDSSAMAASPRR